MNDDLVPVIVGGARTPFGKFRGALSALQATDLGAHAITRPWNWRGVAQAPGWYPCVAAAAKAMP
jgi:acetyl-CoA C-acetyltransferase